MRKDEMIEEMAASANITKAQAGKALDAFFDNVAKALKKRNGKVTLVNFGSFQKQYRKTREGRNPQTGQPMKIKGKNIVKFRPGKKLRDFIA